MQRQLARGPAMMTMLVTQVCLPGSSLGDATWMAPSFPMLASSKIELQTLARHFDCAERIAETEQAGPWQKFRLGQAVIGYNASSLRQLK